MAILFNNNFEYNITNIEKDDIGNYLIVDLKLSDFTLKLINIYAPNVDSPHFFRNLKTKLEHNRQNYTIICGDYNLILDPKIDCSNYINLNNPQARKVVLDLMRDQSLIDVYRSLNPQKTRFTWRKKKNTETGQVRLFFSLGYFV